MAKTTFYVCSPTQSKEKLFVVGDCVSLGQWLPHKAVQLHLHAELEDSQKVLPSILRREAAEYRILFLLYVDGTSGSAGSPLLYGDYGGSSCIQNGWLTCQSEIHLRLHSDALKSSKYSGFRVHCSAFRCMDDGSNVPIEDTMVAVLGDENPLHVAQTEEGTLINRDDYVEFSLQTCFTDSVAFCLTVRSDEGEFLGRVHLPPLKTNEGVTHAAIVSNDHHITGVLRVDHLIVRPLANHTSDMRVSYAQHWKQREEALHIGHRGSGNSFSKTSAKICENTLRSLQYAGDHGADLVEFDVHLSHDRVPIVYHDFNVCVAATEAANSAADQWLPVPIHSLTTAQMKALKFGHMSELGQFPKERSDDRSADLQLFTPLKEFLSTIDPLTGFNLEIKYCCREKSGSYEEGLEYFEERNSYLDCILENMLPFAKKRRILFSSFDPDICTLLALKQPTFPVFFLSLGKTLKYVPYLDPRGNDAFTAANFCRSRGLMGVVVHAEDILRDLTIIQKLKKQGLRVFSWGDDNNSPENLKLQQNHGVDGLIYDRIYENRGEGNIFKRSKKSENGTE
ncbi:hypothetical protein CAPTEDRAFT_223175 [Capitella teleta]|uniref:GP-PDE domain-containing protein n=1 Tax=Capitella teleta TaxID=283909 RepID=R7TQ68_CAPTE|nr:hypothetical protein CAPTEDRAFT_223175 [Capitella teleta]|eukprot:ELT93656.1 hypothetical protein CAPTEDRAFT_223175 [Capitella teleta]